MSQHPSLKSSKVGRKLRTVLRRYERFFTLKQKGVLNEDSSVFGMPKLKIVRTKVRKEKSVEKPEEQSLVSEGGTTDQKGPVKKPVKEEKKKVGKV